MHQTCYKVIQHLILLQQVIVSMHHRFMLFLVSMDITCDIIIIQGYNKFGDCYRLQIFNVHTHDGDEK